jgi:hypothetical protein
MTGPKRFGAELQTPIIELTNRAKRSEAMLAATEKRDL